MITTPSLVFTPAAILNIIFTLTFITAVTSSPQPQPHPNSDSHPHQPTIHILIEPQRGPVPPDKYLVGIIRRPVKSIGEGKGKNIIAVRWSGNLVVVVLIVMIAVMMIVVMMMAVMVRVKVVRTWTCTPTLADTTASSACDDPRGGGRCVSITPAAAKHRATARCSGR